MVKTPQPETETGRENMTFAELRAAKIRYNKINDDGDEGCPTPYDDEIYRLEMEQQEKAGENPVIKIARLRQDLLDDARAGFTPKNDARCAKKAAEYAAIAGKPWGQR